MSIRNKLSDVASKKPVALPVVVPEWDDAEVYVQPMTGEEWEEHIKTERDVEEGVVSSTALIYGTVLGRLVEQNGDRIFNDDELPELLKLPVDGLFTVYTVIVNRQARIEAAKKNSNKTKS